jgi:HEPN domain-containing protein
LHRFCSMRYNNAYEKDSSIILHMRYESAKVVALGIKSMIDITKQIEHWRTGSSEDWAVAKELVERDRIRHGLFFAHLALEKLLKSQVCKTTQNLAPPIHNLVRLAELSGITIDDHLLDLLAEVSPFNIETRYPDMLVPEPSMDQAMDYLNG